MRREIIVVVALFAMLLFGLGASAETKKAQPFGWCWVKVQSVSARMDDENGHMKPPTSSFPCGKPLRVSSVSGAKVWVGGFYVRPHEVVFDPRLTDQWEAARLNSMASSLWGRVEEMAGSKKFPSLTEAIICDIATSGVIPGVKVRKDLGSPKEMAKKFTDRELDAILLDYSRLAW